MTREEINEAMAKLRSRPEHVQMMSTHGRLVTGTYEEVMKEVIRNIVEDYWEPPFEEKNNDETV